MTAHIILNGAMLGFIAREASDCKGCLFDGCRSDVCREAGHQAARVGLPDCEAPSPAGGYIYVEADHRQGELLGAES